MPTSTEGLVRRLRSFADRTKPVVDLLTILVCVALVRLLCDATRFKPAVRVELECVLPYTRVDLADGGRREDEVTLRNNVGTFFRGCSERRRDGRVVDNLADDTVDGRVEAEGLADDGVQHRELLELLVGQGTELSFLSGAKELYLLLVQRLTEARKNQSQAVT